MRLLDSSFPAECGHTAQLSTTVHIILMILQVSSSDPRVVKGPS